MRFLRDRIRRKLMRVRTPVILQMDSAECGSAALAMILAYFGRYVPPSEVREACDVTRDGSKAINIIKAGREYGLESHGMQLALEEVKQLPPPFIVYWQFNHFLVVEGFVGNKIYLNDPATGPRTVTLEEFDHGYTGIVLFFAPGDDFSAGGTPEPSLLTLLWRQLKGSYTDFLYIVFVALASAIPVVALAWFAKFFIDEIFLHAQLDWIPVLLLVMLVTAGLAGLLTWTKKHYLLRLYMKLKLVTTAGFFARLLRMPISFFQQRAVGDIAGRVEAHHSLAELLASKLTQSISILITMVIFAWVMFELNVLLASINLLITIINFAILWSISRRIADLSQRYAQSEGKLTGAEINGIQIIETLKANAVEDQFFIHWAAFHAQKIKNQEFVANNTAVFRLLPLLLQNINTIILLMLGAWLIMQGSLTVGGLIAMQILLFYFNQPLRELLELGEDIYKAKGDVARINDVNEHPIEHILNDDNKMPEIIIKHLSKENMPLVQLERVQFGYSKLEPPIFQDLSITINPRERIAVVGPAGGGKTSLARLICGLFTPWSGEILVGNHPLQDISRQELAACISLVDQRIFMFAATVRDNITLWNPQIADSELLEALTLARIDEVVNERGGLDCWIEERGQNFSGGQVQRLEIARALVGKPQLLILDEATSALDPLLEKEIYTNLQQQNCALLIIAHRLSAIRDCDKILVMDQGKIVQQGTHEALLESSGLYKDLISLEIQ